MAFDRPGRIEPGQEPDAEELRAPHMFERPSDAPPALGARRRHGTGPGLPPRALGAATDAQDAEARKTPRRRGRGLEG